MIPLAASVPLVAVELPASSIWALRGAIALTTLALVVFAAAPAS